MFRESISKLDRYREALNSKKRQRADISNDRGGGVNLTKMGSQIHKTPNDSLTQRSEAKTTNGMLNKRIRTLVVDVQVRKSCSIVSLWFYSLCIYCKMVCFKLLGCRVLFYVLLSTWSFSLVKDVTGMHDIHTGLHV